MCINDTRDSEMKRLMDEIKRLKDERDHYKICSEQYLKLFDSQRDTIDKYHKIFMLQEAELKKLRGESA